MLRFADFCADRQQTIDNRQQTNRLRYPLLRMRAHGVTRDSSWLWLQGGVLYHHWKSITGNGANQRLQLVLPTCLVPNVLTELHNSPTVTGGHLGANKTNEKMRSCVDYVIYRRQWKTDDRQQTTDDRQQTNRLLYPLLHMRAHGVITATGHILSAWSKQRFLEDD